SDMGVLTRGCILCVMLAVNVAAQDDECPIERKVTVTVQTNKFPALPGDAVTLGVFVEPVISIADPTGMVELSDGVTDLGTFPLKLSPTATTLAFKTAGAHVIHVVYSGVFNYCSAVTNFGQAVDRLGTSLSLAANRTTSTVGAPVTL